MHGQWAASLPVGSITPVSSLSNFPLPAALPYRSYYPAAAPTYRTEENIVFDYHRPDFDQTLSVNLYGIHNVFIQLSDHDDYSACLVFTVGTDAR
jgi:hypothetical protein